MNDLKTVVLDNGRGYRLRPFTLWQSKGLLPVANVPLLRRLLAQIHTSGIHEVVLALPRMAGVGEAAAKLAPPGLCLEVIHPGPSVTGSVSTVQEAIAGQPSSVLVIYGDSFLSMDFRKLLEFHQAARQQGALATIVYHRPADLRKPEKNGRTYHGVMSVDMNGRVTKFVEKPLVSTIGPGFDLANAAVFVVERKLLDRPEFHNAEDFSFNIFQPIFEPVTQDLPIFACDIGTGFRFDIGSIARWHERNLAVLRGEIVAFIPGREIAPRLYVGENFHGPFEKFSAPCLVGQNAEVADSAQVGPETIIGDNCQIGERCQISRSVILNNCSIGAGVNLDGCLIGPYCVVGADVKLPKHTVLGPYAVVAGSDWPNWAESEEFVYA